jgi:hypothetical protein
MYGNECKIEVNVESSADDFDALQMTAGPRSFCTIFPHVRLWALSRTHSAFGQCSVYRAPLLHSTVMKRRDAPRTVGNLGPARIVM